MIAEPVTCASAIIPSCALYFGPLGPSGVIAALKPSWINVVSSSNAWRPRRLEDPRTAWMSRCRNASASSAPSLLALTSAASPGAGHRFITTRRYPLVQSASRLCQIEKITGPFRSPVRSVTRSRQLDDRTRSAVNAANTASFPCHATRCGVTTPDFCGGLMLRFLQRRPHEILHPHCCPKLVHRGANGIVRLDLLEPKRHQCQHGVIHLLLIG